MTIFKYIYGFKILFEIVQLRTSKYFKTNLTFEVYFLISNTSRHILINSRPNRCLTYTVLCVYKENVTRKFLYSCAFGVFTYKLFDIYLWKFHKTFVKAVTLSCASFQSVQWKLYMIWTLIFTAWCKLNGMTDSLRTKTRMKKISDSHRLPNLTVIPHLWSSGNGRDFVRVKHVTLRCKARDNEFLSWQGSNKCKFTKQLL